MITVEDFWGAPIGHKRSTFFAILHPQGYTKGKFLGIVGDNARLPYHQKSLTDRIIGNSRGDMARTFGGMGELREIKPRIRKPVKEIRRQTIGFSGFRVVRLRNTDQKEPFSHGLALLVLQFPIDLTALFGRLGPDNKKMTCF